MHKYLLQGLKVAPFFTTNRIILKLLQHQIVLINPPIHLRIAKLDEASILIFETSEGNAIQKIELQRSNDGNFFETIKTIDTLQNKVNAYTDNTRQQNVYYRVKYISNGGVFGYSNIVNSDEFIAPHLQNMNVESENIPSQIVNESN